MRFRVRAAAPSPTLGVPAVTLAGVVLCQVDLELLLVLAALQVLAVLKTSVRLVQSACSHLERRQHHSDGDAYRSAYKDFLPGCFPLQLPP